MPDAENGPSEVRYYGHPSKHVRPTRPMTASKPNGQGRKHAAKPHIVEVRGRKVEEPWEDWEQADLIAKADKNEEGIEDIDRLFAIPNGAPRWGKSRTLFIETGLKAGVLDLEWPVARGGYLGLWIELKRRVSGAMSDEQKDWAEWLANHGWATFMARGSDDAWNRILWYHSLPRTVVIDPGPTTTECWKWKPAPTPPSPPEPVRQWKKPVRG